MHTHDTDADMAAFAPQAAHAASEFQGPEPKRQLPEGFAIALLWCTLGIALIGVGVLAVAGRFGWLN